MPTQRRPLDAYLVLCGAVTVSHQLAVLAQLDPLGGRCACSSWWCISALAFLASHRHTYPHYFTAS
jgi:hypothetical protein